jgi:hypothetical protein
MPLNETKFIEKVPEGFEAKAQAAAIDSQMDDFAKHVVSRLELVKSSLDAKAPGETESLMGELAKLPKEEFVTSVLKLADSIDIDTLKKTDPKFNRLNAFLRSVGNTGMLTIPIKAAAILEAPFSDKTVGEILKREEETSRLMEKAFPGATVGGVIASFVNPEGLAQRTFLKAGEVGIGATKFGAKMIEAFTKKLGSDPAFAKRMGELISKSQVIKTTAVGAAGSAGFTAVKEGVNLAGNVALGGIDNEDVPEALKQMGAKIASSAEEGAQFGFGFAALGAGALATYRVGKSAAAKGLRIIGGPEARYALDNAETMRRIFEATPELVTAQSAEKIAPVVKRIQGEFRAIETEAKNTILKELGNKKLELTQKLQGTAEELNSAVVELRQAAESGVAGAARNLIEKTGKAYSAANRAYGEGLAPIVQKTQGAVPLDKPLSIAEKVLRGNGALDARGRLLPGSDWAQANPELFQSLGDFWQRLGGEVKIAGGKGGINKNLADAIQLKRQLGELANFGSRPTYFEKVYRDMYFAVKDAAEEVAPALKPLNAEYTANRAKIDGLRSTLGKNEATVQARLRKNLLDDRNLFLREALEGFSGLGDEFAAASGEAQTMSGRLNFINQVKKDPKAVFGQIRAAYINGDQITLSALERVAEKNPRLTQILRTAKTQAEVIKELPKPGTVGRAAQDPAAADALTQAVPNARAQIDQMASARQRATELERVLPQDRLALESKLSNPNFAEGQLEQQVIQQAARGNPELAQPLQQAEAARVAGKLKTGKIEKLGLEQFPILGDTLYALRSNAARAAPAADAVFKSIGNAGEKLRKSLIGEIFERLQGSQRFNPEQLKSLIQAVEPEAALIIYAQNGGAEDIMQAAEQTGIALGRDGGGNAPR